MCSHKENVNTVAPPSWHLWLPLARSALVAVATAAFLISSTGSHSAAANGSERDLGPNPRDSLLKQAGISIRIAQARRLEKALSVLADPQATVSATDGCMVEVRQLPTIEVPEFWVGIITNSAFSVDRRREALVALFQRHFPPGTPLGRFGEVLGRSGWDLGRTIFNAAAFSHTPLKNEGESVFMYQPDLLRQDAVKYGHNGGVCFSLSKHVSPLDLISILKGEKPDEGIFIVELSASPGPILPSAQGAK